MSRNITWYHVTSTKVMPYTCSCLLVHLFMLNQTDMKYINRQFSNFKYNLLISLGLFYNFLISVERNAFKIQKIHWLSSAWGNPSSKCKEPRLKLVVSCLRWLKTVSSTFQDADFDVLLLPLFINCCYNHGIKKMPNHWWTRWYYFRDTIGYHSNTMTC